MNKSLLLSLLLSSSCAAMAFEQVNVVGEYKSYSYKKPVAAAAVGDRVYVLDKGNSRLVLFTEGRKLPDFIGKAGDGPGRFDEPAGLCVTASGLIYVADTGNDRVQAFDRDGNFLFGFGNTGEGASRLSAPEAVAAGQDGMIYVADTGNSRVAVFTEDGVYARSFTGVAEPAVLSVDGEGNIFVMGAAGGEVVRFAPDGTRLGALKVAGRAFCANHFGLLYSASADKGKVIEFSADGLPQGEFGTLGKGKGQFRELASVDAADNGDILITDSGNKNVTRIAFVTAGAAVAQKPAFNASMTLAGPLREDKAAIFPFVVSSGVVTGYYCEEKVFKSGSGAIKFGEYGKEPGKTREPRSIAFSAKNGFYVSDSGNDRVEVFGPDGKFIRVIGERAGFMGSSSKEGRMDEPAGVAADSGGGVFVADEGNYRIQQFTVSGMFVNAAGPKLGKYKLDKPVGIVILEDNHRLVLDRGLKKVFELLPNGNLKQVWGEAGEMPGQFINPVSIAYDGREFVYVLDAGDGRVKIFTREGKFKAAFFARGTGRGEYMAPAQIAFSGDSLYITDPERKKFDEYRFKMLLAPPVVSTFSVSEDEVALAWRDVNNAWLAQYRVYRSTRADSGYALIFSTQGLAAREVVPVAPATYYYKLSAVSLSGGEGLLSPAHRVFVPGSLNVPKLNIQNTDINYIFSANYKYYLKNPIGYVELANNTDTAFKDVKLSFEMKDFMDFPFDKIIKRIPAREKVRVPLLVTLSNRILEISEDTPVQAKLTAAYFMNEREREQTLTLPVKVLSRNAIIWDKPDRLGNFITPKDPPVFDFTKKVILEQPKKGAQLIDHKLGTALMLWSGASAYGLQFMSDPANPYETVKASVTLPVDTVQMPRDTLRLKSGECDDLTALLSAMFEGAGLRTALLDYPSHIALMFDTGKSTPEEAGLPGDRMIKHDGTWWVPVEATMLGRSFADSTKQGITTYSRNVESVKIMPVQTAWKEFEPVTLAKTDWTPDIPPADAMRAAYLKDSGKFADERFAFLSKACEQELKETPDSFAALNSLGILYAEYGKTSDARDYFERILKLAPSDSSALNNMGNIEYLKGDYERAQLYYKQAAEADPNDGRIALNLARTAHQLNRKDEIDGYLKRAVSLAPELQETADLIKLQ
ncbi:MAG: tetratricopeptide repeat protein [Elusimicrobiaceae bacterium]|nr:tetratricopeptide repeat protein [Elusimicrobiaceae bacterium]